jgi:hypothetical protein
MKKIQSLGAALALLGASGVYAVSASTLEIQFTGLDLIYDGGTQVFDAKSPITSSAIETYADELLSVDFIFDGEHAFSLGVEDGIYADVSLSLAAPLTANGGPVGVEANTFQLIFDGLPGLALNFNEAMVSYHDFGVAEFVLGGGSAVMYDPAALVSGNLDSTAVSFSFSLNNLQPFGQGFLAGGTGEIVASDALVETPVPAAAWLFGSALLGLAGLRKRR